MKVGILLDDHLHRPGGVQEHVRGLYRYLERHGHEAVIFTGGSHYGADFSEHIIPMGISFPLKGSGNWTSVPLTLRPPWEIRRILRQEACDVLDVQSPFSPTMSGRLLAQSDAAHVMTFLVTIDSWLRLRLFSLAARAQHVSLRRFHHRVAVSETAAETARILYGNDHYTIIPDALAIEDFAAAAEEPRLPQFDDGRVAILFVGRLEERKGAAHLLRAFATIEREYRGALRLVIAGEGPEDVALRKLVADLGLQGVEFLGYVARQELPRLMASCHIFCAPSTGNEAFGRILIEAMAAGLPIVAFDNAGYTETLQRHPGNLVVPVGDARALAHALRLFVAGEALRTEVGHRNRLEARRYSWDVVGAQFLQVYEQAIEKRTARPPG